MQKNKMNNIHISENQSMLVSERKPEDEASSRMVKEKINLVQCRCQSRLQKIENKIEMLGLRLQEISANVNISFTKHMQVYGKLVEEQKRRENIQYTIWDMKEVNKAVVEKVNRDIEKNNKQMEGIGEEIKSWTRLLRELKNWKNSQSAWASGLEKEIYESMKSNKKESEEKLKKMYDVIEEIGLLQRKMVMQRPERSENNPPRWSKSKNISVLEPRMSLPYQKSSFANESTILGTSHNYY